MAARSAPTPTSPIGGTSPVRSPMRRITSLQGPLGHSGSHHHFHIDLNPTIYTTLLYAPAIARIRTGKEWSKAVRMSLALVCLNMVLQLGLLRVMDVYGHRDEQVVAGMIEHEQPRSDVFEKTYAAGLSSQEREVLEQGQTDPLCSVDSHGTYSCMPSSVHFAAEWHMLDLDGDGVWSMSEAMAVEQPKHTAKKSKTPGVDQVKLSATESESLVKTRMVFFNSIVNGLKHRSAFLETLNGTLYLAQDLKAKLAIPKAYFEYWMGDAMLCSRFDSSTCDHVVASGLFDAAITKGRLAAAQKGIFDYDSALKYCQVMLEPAGGCDHALPASYREARLQRSSTCGAVSLHGDGFVTNPHDPTEVLPVMEPSFANVSRQQRAAHSTFLFFKVLIMYLFYASVVDEVRDLIKTSEFLIRFDSIRDADDRGGIDFEKPTDGEAQVQRGADGERYQIHRISRKHRAGMTAVVVARFLILFLLMRFGSWFLLNESRYIELVMNALALAFITGIDEMLHATFLEKTEQADDGYDEVAPISYESTVPHFKTSWIGYLFRKECWGLFLIPCLCIIVVTWNVYFARIPTIDAMTCACLQEGAHCAESMVNQGSWWQHYWTRTLPAAIHQIEALRLQAA